MYCVDVGRVELTVMLFVASVKHLYRSPSQRRQAALPKVSSFTKTSVLNLQHDSVTADVLYNNDKKKS